MWYHSYSLFMWEKLWVSVGWWWVACRIIEPISWSRSESEILSQRTMSEKSSINILLVGLHFDTSGPAPYEQWPLLNVTKVNIFITWLKLDSVQRIMQLLQSTIPAFLLLKLIINSQPSKILWHLIEMDVFKGLLWVKTLVTLFHFPWTGQGFRD